MVKHLGDFLWRYAPALLLGGAIVATAPIMGQLRDFFFAAFPGQALRTIAILLGVLVGGLFLLALWRIREHRLLRYGGLVLVAALLWLQVVGFARGMAQVDVVERIHVLEYGSLAALVYWGRKRSRPAPSWPVLACQPIFAATLAGVFDESAQRFFQLRVADFRDVALNAFAALVGVLFAALLSPPRQLSPAAGSAPSVLRGLAITLAGLGLFAVAAHFGHEIVDPELGRFRSFYDEEGLREAAADRALRWAADPPIDLDPWSRKDLFLDEAARHTNYRNSGLEAGNLPAALRANEILEKYYAPFLAVRGYHGVEGNRWPPELVAELRAKTGAPLPPSFESPVLRDHLVTIPKLPFLTLLGAVVVLLWTLSFRLRGGRNEVEFGL